MNYHESDEEAYSFLPVHVQCGQRRATSPAPNLMHGEITSYVMPDGIRINKMKIPIQSSLQPPGPQNPNYQSQSKNTGKDKSQNPQYRETVYQRAFARHNNKGRTNDES